MAEVQEAQRKPRCVATSEAVQDEQHPAAPFSAEAPAAFFKSAQWSPDGTCVITNNSNNTLRTYIIPVDLLENPIQHNITPYHINSYPNPVLTFTLHPAYSLSDPSTTLVLSSTRDLPIQLHNTLYPYLHDSYKLINPQTEQFIAPHSLSFTHDGTRFITGSDSLLCVFDVSRNGEGPISRLPTIPSRRKKIVGGGVGMKGIVSALGVSCEGILAAGTFNRTVGLYSDEGQGDVIAIFSIAGEEEGTFEDGGVGGTGVTQCIWSPCGRYLYIVERMSDGALMYDIRVTGKKLGVLTGRAALTNQRMGVEVVATTGVDGGHDVCAGGIDGVVRVWKNPHSTEGRVMPQNDWKLHDDVISSTTLHPTANVLATCSGQRHGFSRKPKDMDDDIRSGSDSSYASSADSGSHSVFITDSSHTEEEDALPTQDYSLKLWTL